MVILSIAFYNFTGYNYVWLRNFKLCTLVTYEIENVGAPSTYLSLEMSLIF